LKQPKISNWSQHTVHQLHAATMKVEFGASLECANLLALWYFYQSGDKSPHSKEAPTIIAGAGDTDVV
jgi:hypothetical protein